MESKETKVESFCFDHRKVKAPYVRKCCLQQGEKGDCISKFDLRFCQPNRQALDTAAIHALEHLLAENLRKYMDGVIDLSPMGCRTGFYVTVWGDRQPREMRSALLGALDDVLAAAEVPAANEIQCGNWKDLSLEGAKQAARKAMEEGFSLDPFERLMD
ncbi:MAG: S-ribosylhomocysteine lyase [Candidatus Cryptobacteroides sp.]